MVLKNIPSHCFTVGRTIGYIIREYTTLIIVDYTKRHNNTAIITYQQLVLFLENSYEFCKATSFKEIDPR